MAASGLEASLEDAGRVRRWAVDGGSARSSLPRTRMQQCSVLAAPGCKYGRARSHALLLSGVGGFGSAMFTVAG
jgi:hypothetical protein